MILTKSMITDNNNNDDDNDENNYIDVDNGVDDDDSDIDISLNKICIMQYLHTVHTIMQILIFFVFHRKQDILSRSKTPTTT